MEYKQQNISDVLSRFPQNQAVQEMVFKTLDHIENEAIHDGKILVSISGGSDSDIMIDLFERIGYPIGLVVYVWFDTGLEYDATKRHLKDLEDKYNVKIVRYRPKLTVAQAVKRKGYPFISKEISEKIRRGYCAGFDWDSSVGYEEMIEKYGRVKAFAKWWCSGVREARFSVEGTKGLKQFLEANPPQFQISDLCCDNSKKSPARKAIKDFKATLDVTGVRRAEGGIRTFAYKSCFSEKADKKVAQFRPLFYLTDKDKQEYKEFCGVTYSDCYEVWGFKRTGCACCPFGSGFEQELETVKKYEPKLYAAACKIFGPSYEYTRAYRKFKEAYKAEKKRGGQIGLFDNPENVLEMKE